MADVGRENAWGQPEGMLEALRDFREAAETSTVAWGQDITVQQGLDIAWVLGTVIRDFRVATERLSQYQVTVDPGDDATPPTRRSGRRRGAWTRPGKWPGRVRLP